MPKLKIALIITLLALNFASLKYNFLNVAHPHAFNVLRGLSSTTLVIGRIVKSRVDGIFSAGGFVGRFRVPKKYEKIPGPKYQYMLFNGEAGIPQKPKFQAYRSQTGGQGIFFSFFDWVLSGSLSPQNRLMVFNSFSVALLAILISFIVVWIFNSWGYIAGIFAQLSILLSPQLIIFGDNIWWQPWSYFFPFVLLLLNSKRYFMAAFFGFSVKFFFTGYEYITTAFIILYNTPQKLGS